jgi:hypothetical protein
MNSTESNHQSINFPATEKYSIQFNKPTLIDVYQALTVDPFSQKDHRSHTQRLLEMAVQSLEKPFQYGIHG